MLRTMQTISSPLIESEIASNSTLKPTTGGWQKVLLASLMLTSLVDAFSILVVYLLLNYSAEEVISLDKKIDLPAATQVLDTKRNVVVTLKEGKVYIGNEEIGSGRVLSHLINLRKQASKKNNLENSDPSNMDSLTIQADKSTEYKVLNRILLASQSSGYTNINFAVLEK